VHEVASVRRTTSRRRLPLFRGLKAEFIRGMTKVGDQLVVILDVDRVMSSADRIAFDQSPAASRG
jgi:chemotaxis signal transduction protein